LKDIMLDISAGGDILVPKRLQRRSLFLPIAKKKKRGAHLLVDSLFANRWT
jgi:hypothetical protein